MQRVAPGLQQSGSVAGEDFRRYGLRGGAWKVRET
jgi:hypothetical protein